MSWTIVPLSLAGFSASSLKRVKFDCTRDVNNPKNGELQLNQYIKQYALKQDQIGVAKTFVAVSDENIVGYYSSSATLIEPKWIPNPTHRLPIHPIPAFLIGRLAVDRSMQGKGLGSFLLRHAFETASQVSELMGLYAVRIDPSDEEIKGWYLKRSFSQFQDSSSLYMLMPTIKAALLAASQRLNATSNSEIT